MASKVSKERLTTRSKKRLLPSIYDTGTHIGVSNEIFPDQNWTTRRHFECHNMASMSEWDIQKDCDKGLQNLWAGVHRHALTSFDYNSLKYRGQVLEAQRNEIPELSRGDKPYQTPEYSIDFHKMGSTLPVPHFGRRDKPITDTHIPLVDLPSSSKNFAQKERERQRQENVELVELLEHWQPAAPLNWRPSKMYTRPEQTNLQLDVHIRSQFHDGKASNNHLVPPKQKWHQSINKTIKMLRVAKSFKSLPPRALRRNETGKSPRPSLKPCLQVTSERR